MTKHTNRPHRAMSILEIHDTNHRVGWSGLAQNPKSVEINRMATVIQFDNPHYKNDVTDPDRLAEMLRDKVRGHSRMDTVQKAATYKE